MTRLLTLCVCASGIAACAESAGSFYFVAATTTNISTATYPAALYGLGDGNSLKLLRVLSPASDGVYQVQDSDGDVVAMAYPHVNPTNLAVVHKSDPIRVDDVVVNAEGRIVAAGLNCLRTMGDRGPIDQLLGIARNLDPKVPGVNVDVKKVFLDLPNSPSVQRVSSASPEDYAHLFVRGQSGGPSYDYMMFAFRDGNHLALRVGRHPVTLGSCPRPSV